MRIHRAAMRTVRGVPYAKTFLIVPKQIEYDMNLKAGTTMFLSAERPGTMLLSPHSRYADDVPVKLSQYRHKKTGTAIYYSLRFTIPVQFARTHNISRYDEFDASQRGRAIAIEMTAAAAATETAAATAKKKTGAVTS